MYPSVSDADIEPRSYSNIPIGLNFLLAGYIYQSGNIAFAPTIPIANAKLETSSAFLAYVRSLDVWGKSGKVDVIIPEFGYPVKRGIGATKKPRQNFRFCRSYPVRFYVNLFGAPALVAERVCQLQAGHDSRRQCRGDSTGRAIRPAEAGQYRHQSLVYQT